MSFPWWAQYSGSGRLEARFSTLGTGVGRGIMHRKSNSDTETHHSFPRSEGKAHPPRNFYHSPKETPPIPSSPCSN